MAAPFNLLLLAVVSTATHQIFRRYETYSIACHMALLFFPPILLASLFTSRPSELSWTTARTLFHFVIAHLLTLSALVLTYRISPFHPLAHHPGPLRCKLSKFWIGFLSLGGRSHEYIKRLHEEHGDVVRIGPNELSIRDPSVISPLLGSSGAPKGPQFLGKFLDCHSQSMIALQDTETHIERRRPWLRAFAPSAVNEYRELLGRRTHQLVSQLEKQKGVVRLDKWIDYLAYDFMSDMAFGSGPELLENGDGNNFWSVLVEAIQLSMLFSHVPWLGEYLRHIPPVVRPMKALLGRCADLAAQRVGRGSESRDLFHYLNYEDLPEYPPPPVRQLVDDGILAIVAGADTVASALTSVFACLLARPDIYATLEAEIDRLFPEGSDLLDTTNHREMVYLNAAINESLRLFPPVPSCTQRQVPHDGRSITVGSTCIPPGTSFWVHAYSMHRDTRNFYPHTESFWPERWMAERVSTASTSSQTVKHALSDLVHNEGAFLPFSYGPMNCAGKNLAMLELRVVVCAIMQKFSVRPVGGGAGSMSGQERDTFDLDAYDAGYRDFFVTARSPVCVELVVRGAPAP